MSTIAAESTRELAVEEAVAIAIQLQQRQQLAEAHALLDRVLETVPDHPAALHYSGVLAHQERRNAEALQLIGRSLAIEPARADWHSNLGIVLQSENRWDEAIAAYRQALVLDPRHANALNNLGVLLRAKGKPVEAEAAYRSAIDANPEHIDAYTNLGILLNSQNRTEEASACYCKVITLRPKHRDARRLLALAHCALGDIEEAVRIFEAWHAEEPDDPIARHMLAACTGRDVPSRAADEFVETTFDSFAASFESKLQRLAYRAPALVAAVVAASGPPPAKNLDVLDAGCGTGLCGSLLLPFARRLVGVDLSEGMLALAREKSVYEELTKGELNAFMRERPAAFDLIVSADTLVYFGDLSSVLASAAAALRPGGRFIFTLEHASADAQVPPYRLEFHGRYVHAQAYVEQVLRSAGLEAEIRHAHLRMEAGAPVAGLVVGAWKPATRPE
jgi:predicted TPR repeat methyltransferase